MKYSYTSSLSISPLKNKSDPPKESQVVTKPEDSTSDGSLRSRSGFRRFLERLKNYEKYGILCFRNHSRDQWIYAINVKKIEKLDH
jgi:hypothetical protein